MFNYVIEKIENADFRETPFRHVYVEDLFSPDHFSEIVSAREVNIAGQESDSALFDTLFDHGYKIVNFPGCITNKSKYIAWHKNKAENAGAYGTCEGFGVTLRLEAPKSQILRDLKDFLSSSEFNEALARKFGLSLSDTFMDNGIQKYLDGYEISPHPDNRKKALTFMVNINPGADSENQDHHTRYLSLKPEYRYVSEFWKSNTDCETCWIPWDWCDIVSVQSRNNSIVIFSPSVESLHGVRARYNHLEGQRTQLYGNLWFSESEQLQRVEWEHLDIKNSARKARKRRSFKNSATAIIPASGRRFLKRMLKRDSKTVVKVRLKK